RNAGVTIAEINLKLIWDVITALKIGQGGYAYVVDGRGKLIAHPDISLVLRDTDLAGLPQVTAALGPQPDASMRSIAAPRDAAAAGRLGAGEPGRRIEIHTGDELESLADQFNRMAADLQRSYAELEQRVADRTAELSESLEQQTATAEVLGIISSSPGRLQPVFEAIVANAVTVCAGTWGVLVLRDGTGFRGVATHGVAPAFADTRSPI